MGCVGGAGSLLRRRRQSRQHLGRHARKRGREGARSLEQRRRRAAIRGARGPDLWPLRAVPWPSANHRAAYVGCAVAVDRDRRQARRPEVRQDAVPSQADRNGHDRIAGGQHAARYVATGGRDRHIRRAAEGPGNLALVRALWRSAGGGAASGGALLLKTLSAGRLPRPAAPALRPRRPDGARALRALPGPDAQRRATRGPLLLKALSAGRLPRTARAHTQSRPNKRAPAATSRQRDLQRPPGMSDVSRDMSLPAAIPAALRAIGFELVLRVEGFEFPHIDTGWTATPSAPARRRGSDDAGNSQVRGSGASGRVRSRIRATAKSSNQSRWAAGGAGAALGVLRGRPRALL